MTDLRDVADMRFKWYQCGLNLKNRDMTKVDEFLGWLAERFNLPRMQEGTQPEEKE